MSVTKENNQKGQNGVFVVVTDIHTSDFFCNNEIKKILFYWICYQEKNLIDKFETILKVCKTIKDICKEGKENKIFVNPNEQNQQSHEKIK